MIKTKDNYLVEYLDLKYHVDIDKLRYNGYDHTFQMEYDNMVNSSGMHYFKDTAHGMIRIPNKIMVYSSLTNKAINTVLFTIKDINVSRDTTGIHEGNIVTYVGEHNDKRYYIQVILPPMDPMEVSPFTSHSIEYIL